MSDVEEQDLIGRLDNTPSVEAVRMVTVVRIEYGLLGLRYLTLLLLVIWAALGGADAYSAQMVLVALTFLLQSAFAHWVLYQERYHLFVSPLNLVVHLGGICVLVAATGGDSSPLGSLFVLFIVGYGAYLPRILSPFVISIICCIAYSFTLLTYWSFEGMNLGSPPVWIRMVLLVICGWLVNVLCESLRRYQESARQQALALASSEGTLRTILDSVGHPLMVYDDHEFITETNDEACEFLGVPREELIGKRIRAFLFDDGTLPTKMAALRARGHYQGELVVLTDSGEERDVDLLARSFLHDGSRYHVVLMRDITRQKEMQEASRLTQVRMEEANAELQRATELRTTFLTAVSQRLRSPLSAILGFADLLLGGSLGEMNAGQRRAIESCRRSAVRMFDTVNEPFQMPGQSAPVKGDANPAIPDGE